jgi:hypothetical protein
MAFFLHPLTRFGARAVIPPLRSATSGQRHISLISRLGRALISNTQTSFPIVRLSSVLRRRLTHQSNRGTARLLCCCSSPPSWDLPLPRSERSPERRNAMSPSTAPAGLHRGLLGSGCASHAPPASPAHSIRCPLTAFVYGRRCAQSFDVFSLLEGRCSRISHSSPTAASTRSPTQPLHLRNLNNKRSCARAHYTDSGDFALRDRLCPPAAFHGIHSFPSSLS